jgi:hypothetical protein
MLRETALAHQHNDELLKRKKKTILVSYTTCILEQERQGVVEPMGDVNRSISKRRKSTLVIMTMGPLMKANSRWFQIAHPNRNDPVQPQLLAAVVNHADLR